MSKLGQFMVEYRYRVDPLVHAKLWPLLAVMRDYTEHLGLASFEVWQQDDDPWTIIEWHGYDSWSHYQRVGQQPTHPDIEPVYRELGEIIEGGMAAVASRSWVPQRLPPSD